MAPDALSPPITIRVAAGGGPPNGSGHYRFSTQDDPADPTFNQLLAVNDDDMIPK